MSAWINPLDRVPQVPVDYANHLIYGGALGAAAALAAVALVQTPAPTAWLLGAAAACAVQKRSTTTSKRASRWRCVWERRW